MFSSLDTGVPLPNPGAACVRETSRSSVSRSPVYPAIVSVSPLEDSASPQFVLSKTNCLGPHPPDPGPPLLPGSVLASRPLPVLPIGWKQAGAHSVDSGSRVSQRLFPPVQHHGCCLALAMPLLSEPFGRFLASLCPSTPPQTALVMSPP